MENKYYDLIVSLIKNHRKYPGLESILEDIVNDVFEHSKVVLSSVKNEDVIRAYLEKTVATSIITVSKKMNLNVRQRSSIIETIDVAKKVSEVEDNVIIENVVARDSENLEIVDNIDDLEDILSEKNEENIIEIQEEILLTAAETAEEEEEEEEEVSLEEVIEEDTKLSESEEEDVPEFINDIEVLEDNTVELNSPESTVFTEEVDKTLVDKMINGVSTSKVAIEKVEELLSEEVNEFYDALEEVEPIEEFNQETLNTVEEQETPFEEEIIESDSLDIEESVLTFNEELTVSEELLNIDKTSIAFDIDEKTLEENSEDIQESSPNEILETEELNNQFISLSEDDTVDIVLPALNSDDKLEESLVEEDVVTNIIDLEPKESVEVVSNFQLPCFDCFSFEPEKKDSDIEEVFSELSNINKKHPERKILEICELKYTKNLSVSEIAEHISFSEEQVLDVLNEIIEIVKD